ncbi:hypothetical protein [Streptomyces albidoflavus]|uniref:hypothetical protein n=1 Tax=Streptomyces albidoflavus TaxID=1886 RepID=UPI00101E7362|nr:hypothetical protein [Streptomyces albidoflavus]RZD92239.1 hypothetical protein C0Q63_00215 [Streptomyces albidoflavus]
MFFLVGEVAAQPGACKAPGVVGGRGERENPGRGELADALFLEVALYFEQPVAHCLFLFGETAGLLVKAA